MHMKVIIRFLFLILVLDSNAQMIDDFGNVKYGNEWINYSQVYYKFTVNSDGIYRISYQDLKNAGINTSSISGRNFQLFAYGKEVSLYTSTSGSFGSSDYIEFYGEKNKSQLDSFLFRNKNDILNSEYSMFNDNATYYLTWNNSSHKRYQETSNNLSNSLPPKETFYIHEEKIVNTSNYIKPLRSIVNHIYKSNFDTGEGYGSKLQQINTFALKTYDRINTGYKPILNIRLATDLGGHHVLFKVNGNTVKDIVKNGITASSTIISLDYNVLSDNMHVSIEGSSYDDKNSVSTISLLYSRRFKFLNKSYFKFNLTSSNYNRYFEIEDFDIQGNSFVLYDTKNNKRIIPIIDFNNKLVKFILPPSKGRELVLINSNKSVKSIHSLERVSFNNITSGIDKNYIIITKREAFNSGQDLVQGYANYRSSTIGGGYKTMIVDINDIFNQFGYGIERHNQSLNNYIIYIKDKFIDPKFILIIGKGLEYDEIRTQEQLDNPINLFHVPTYGHPGSDNLMAARHGDDYPVLPIGRIAAKNANQLFTYLEKVKKYENDLKYSQTIEDKAWMKKVIHLVGGTPDIIGQIRTSLDFMGTLMKNSNMGAKVNTYERNSGTAQESVTNLIVDDITSGAAMVTFFGHSGVSGTDFNISGLNNDKYPVFYSLGCYSGNIHTNSTNGQSENFVLNEGGVIVYAGTSGTGFTGSLSRLGKLIYNNTGNLMYGHSVGEIVQKSLETTSKEGGGIGSVTLNQQFTFHGDPAIKLHLYNFPDYVVENNSATTIPSEVTAGDNNFILNFKVINIGKGVDDNLTIRVVRRLPNGESEIYEKQIEAPKYRNSISFSIPTDGMSGIGDNCISIDINPHKEIDERPKPQAEENNSFANEYGENSFCFSILSNKVESLYPSQFSIVNESNIELKASLSNYFANPANYVFQIDTSELFNSQLLKEGEISSDKSIITWSPNMNFKSNKVYYWRVGVSNTDEELIEWKNSSFIYLPNSEKGWNQSHYYQYLKDEFDGTTFDGRKFDFESQMRTVRIIGKKYDEGKVCYVDGETWGHMNEFDDIPIINISGWGPDYWFRNKTKTDFNSLPVHEFNSLSFKYKPHQHNQVAGIKALLEAMPDSMTIFFYTILGNSSSSLYPETWAKDSIDLGYNLFSLMEGYGAKKLRLMESRGTVPYILVFKKGMGVIQEEIGETIDDVFEISQNVLINRKKGNFISKLIGPAKRWNTVSWQESNKDENDIDSYVVVYKVDKDNNKTVVDTLRSVYNLNISDIDAQQYPYLQLKYYAIDKLRRDPPKLDFWRVLYKEFPDAILKQTSSSYFLSDTLNFGEQLKFKSSIFNNTTTDMGPILVRFKIKRPDRQDLIYNERYPALLANSSYDISFEYDNSAGELSGYNEFSVEINADNEQEEKSYTNNTGTKSFYVKSSSLPVQLLSFDARKKRNSVLVYWETLNEINCDEYILEKSLNGKDFKELESVIAKGNNNHSKNTYSLEDIYPYLGVNYYRLKQMDLDGKVHYSKIISVIFDNNDRIMISPNPFTNQFEINAYFYNENNEVAIVNTDGKVLFMYNLKKGFNKIKINSDNLTKGFYFCKINNGKKIKTFKILKL